MLDILLEITGIEIVRNYILEYMNTLHTCYSTRQNKHTNSYEILSAKLKRALFEWKCHIHNTFEGTNPPIAFQSK